MQNDIKQTSSNEGVTNKNNITTFEEDTGTTPEEIPAEITPPIVQFMDIPGSDSIVDFLERPTVLTQGNLSTADLTTLWSTDPFLTLVTGSKAPKLNGIYGIKADVVIDMHINATRFQAGRYLLGFVPSGGIPISTPNFVNYFKSHATSLCNMTQLPHVEIDVASETHVTLNLPWQSVAPFFVNLSTYPVGFGKLFLFPYSPLNAVAGPVTASYTIWAHFENISLVGPTFTQSGRLGVKEAARIGKGPVETTLDTVSSISTLIGTIPTLTAAAKGVGWSAAILAKAAHSFGWSKPLDMAAPQAVRTHPLKFFENVDGVSTAKNLGAFSTTSLNPVPENVTSTVDEMSYDFLKQKYAYFQSQFWGETSIAGYQIFTIPVNPYQSTNYGTGVLYTPVGFLSALHDFWRGSLKYRFKIVKNEFYSGRIQIAFEPNFNATNVSTTIAQTEFDSRVIVDIRDTNEVEVIVPYISPYMYQATAESIGNLIVTVVDPLVAPTTVPNSVQILVEIAGGPDLEFASPNPLFIEPWSPFTSQSARTSSVQAVLGSPSNGGSIVPAEIAMGEKLSSLRQLWKIPTPVFAVTGGPVISFTNGEVTYAAPYKTQFVNQITSNTSSLLRGTYYGDRVDLVTSLYMATTGSNRIVVSDFSRVTWMAGREYVTPRPMLTLNVHGISNSDEMRVPIDCSQEPFDVLVPPYQKTMGRSVAAQLYCDSSSPVSPIWDYCSYSTLVYVPISSTTGAFRRTPADDSNCWGFVSIPATVSRNQS